MVVPTRKGRSKKKSTLNESSRVYLNAQSLTHIEEKVKLHDANVASRSQQSYVPVHENKKKPRRSLFSRVKQAHSIDLSIYIYIC